MPELPEVETIRRHLEPFVVGRRLEKLEILDPMWCEPAPPATLDDAVRGRAIETLGRRGKRIDFCRTPIITWKVGPPA